MRSTYRFGLLLALLAIALLPAWAFAQATCAVTHRIHQIQGNATTQLAGGAHDDISPLNGQTVTIEGIVVADFQSIPQPTRSGELRGFFVQEEAADEDGDSSTSEGSFVFSGSTPAVDVQEGQRVCVQGAVSEFFGMTQLTATSAGSVLVTSASEPLPPAATLALPVVGDLNDFYERFEGMRVTFTNTFHVSEYFEVARYGQIVLTAGGRPYQYSHVDTTPTAAEYAAFRDALSRLRIILDDDNNVQNAPLPAGTFFHPSPLGFGIGTQGTNFYRGGDIVENLVGVLHWSFAGQSGTDAWRIRPTKSDPVVFNVDNPRPAQAPVKTGNVRVVGFNVLNYFNTIDTTSSTSSGPCGPSGTLDCRGADSAAEFERQSEKLVAALAAVGADVIGLTELENNGGSMTPAIAELTNRLNAKLTAPVYKYVATGNVGTDAITVGLLYKAATMFPTAAPAILTAPEFADPNHTGLQRNRPAIAQTFEVIGTANPDRGAIFTVVVNHLKSKGVDGATGADADALDGQSAWNDTRTRAASYLVNTWIPQLQQIDPDVLIIGDLNAYRGETPITTIKSAGYADLHEAFHGLDGYSYVFDGQLGYLDHALSSPTLTPQVANLAAWPINADEVPVFDYNDTLRDAPGEAAFEAEPTGNPLYEPNEFRTSDHDPVIVDLDLDAPLVGDVNRDGDVGKDDLLLVIAARNKPATGPNDPRDLNGDGKVDALDVRLLVLRCTMPGCGNA